MYTRINPRDEAAVIWLQRALNQLLPWPRAFVIGQLDDMTAKAIQAYQKKYDLPETDRAMLRGREVDESLLQHIKAQLEEKGLTVS